MPSGMPARLTCIEAKQIVAQARDALAYQSPSALVSGFVDGTLDWIDPHGFWAVAQDAPIRNAVEQGRGALIAEIDGAGASGSCDTATSIGRAMKKWIDGLRGRYDEGHRTPASDVAAAFEPVSNPDDVRAASVALGSAIAAFERFATADPNAAKLATDAKQKFLPSFTEDEWTEVVLAGAVRAYVTALDAHSEWAPLDEEVTISEVDLVAHAPEKSWGRAQMTALGAVLTETVAPFEEGDVLLSVGNLSVAGLSPEQLVQLGFAAFDESAPPMRAWVYRRGKLVYVEPDRSPSAASGSDAPESLAVERIPYGNGQVIVVAIHEVKDNLGDLFHSALTAPASRSGEEEAGDGTTVGVVLDLRDNGGGSADGAAALLGHLMPGVPLFPTKGRDGSVEVEYAPEPEPEAVWTGPVATLVDTGTASAAEMIAGAISAYGRGPSVGTTTFGKGCEQEYIDDEPKKGVLKLTTLLYALPDGSPVQRVGLSPTIALPWSQAAAHTDREETYPNSPRSWRGPDVRKDVHWSRRADWSDATQIGPCTDPDVCRALHAIAARAGRRKPVAKHK
jgi:carboxyl-terminal processing protease